MQYRYHIHIFIYLLHQATYDALRQTKAALSPQALR